MTDDDPRALYHAGEHTYLEIVNHETGSLLPIQDGQEGELLITADAGDDATFPLVKYRIGDTVRIVESACKKHGGWSFEVLGRTTMDFLKVPGGILRADEVERVLRELHISDRFELHRYEHSTSAGLKTQVVLHVQAPPEVELEALALSITKLLRVSAAYTYEDGVREGLYMPLVCELLPIDLKPGKTVRMVQH
jgi:phenylacetate-coenzyme A ligase PaaK-like adenylate-forming protein